MAELPRAAFVPDRTVRIAAAMLPASARDRYEREFLSELFGLTIRQQTRYAFDILCHTASLRTAVHREAGASEFALTTRAQHPLGCRLNVHHRWITKSTTDGGRYQRCRRCGKDRTEVDGNSNLDTPEGRTARAAVPGGFGGGSGWG